MGYQAIFKRYELKYLLDAGQKEKILRAMEPYMALDRYGRTTIQNLYFDTETYRLVRRSIEAPAYKEKLRVRSYGKASPRQHRFCGTQKEIPKDRVQTQDCPAGAGGNGLGDGPEALPDACQISAEIDYFLQYYGVRFPAVFLSYEREAFSSRDRSEFRVTFDDTILCRQTDLSLQSEAYGQPVLPEGRFLMELKCPGSIPLWMTHILTEKRIYRTSFSKYGVAYQTLIYPGLKKGGSSCA